MTRRAIGIVRVSVTKGREGERFASPEDQRDRIQAVCKRDGLALVEVHEEMDVSGGKSLADRPGLGAAVAAIEDGKAEVVAAAYFDRLFRSLQTQAEVIDRIEKAGGRVLAVDVGHVTNASAGQWLSGTMMGAVSEYFRRSAKERSGEGQARAVARGAVPWSRVPIGYQRGENGTLAPDPQTVPIALRAYEMRAEGASLAKVRDMLNQQGVERSHRGVQVMLANRAYLGEIHFGEHVNLAAHEAIIERELFERVQRMVVPRGRRSSSARLLARLGVLRCGSCGARMSAMKMPQQNDYPIYRCPSTSVCARHVTISATIAEGAVVDATRQALADKEGRASGLDRARDAVAALDRAQDELDGALRSFVASGLQDEPAAVERLSVLRQARDDAQLVVDRLGPQSARVTHGDRHWDDMSVAEQRDLIRDTIESATVRPGGRGVERIDIRAFLIE